MNAPLGDGRRPFVVSFSFTCLVEYFPDEPFALADETFFLLGTFGQFLPDGRCICFLTNGTFVHGRKICLLTDEPKHGTHGRL